MKFPKATQYLVFRLEYDTGKTLVVSVFSIHSGERLGVVKWFFRWRQYTFFPEAGTTFNERCLDDINGVMNRLMEERET